jgi:hypothetical protein
VVGWSKSPGHETTGYVRGTSRETVSRWAARGRAPGAPAGHRAFAQRLDEIRAAEAMDVPGAEREPELPPGHPWNWTGPDDPFIALEPESMAFLNPEEHQRAIEVCEA